MKKVFSFGLAALLAIGLVGCSSTPSEPANPNQSGGTSTPNESAKPAEPELTEVKFGLMPYYDYAPWALAEEQGFFKEEGISFKPTMFPVEGNVAPALINGSIDIGAFSDTPSITLASQFPDLQMISFNNVFKGFAIMSRSDTDVKTYQQLLEEAGDPLTAAIEAGKQMKGKSIVTTSGATFYMVVEQALKNAGLTIKDVKIVDMEPDAGVSAFISGVGDFYLGGLPQRERLQEQGYPALISGEEIGSGAVILAGLASTKEFVEKNPEIVQKISNVWFKTMEYMSQHPDESYQFVADWSNKQSGGNNDAETIKQFFADYLIFAESKEQAKALFYDPASPTYWKDRYESLVQYHEETDVIKKDSVNLDNLVIAEQIFNQLP